MEPEVIYYSDTSRIEVRVDSYEDRMNMIKILTTQGYTVKLVEKNINKLSFAKHSYVQFWIDPK